MELLDFGSLQTWGIIASIIAVDLLLSGDNAVVIALASRRLKDGDRRKALIYGTLGAVLFLVCSATVVSFLIRIPFLQATGGALLAWIALKLLIAEDDQDVSAAPTLAQAIRTIIFADVVMSIDNMVAVAGTAQGNTAMIAMGLAVSIPIIIFGGSAIGRLIKRFPVVIDLGAGFLGWTSGRMFFEDAAFEELIAGWVRVVWPLVEGALVVLSGRLILARREPAVRPE